MKCRVLPALLATGSCVLLSACLKSGASFPEVTEAVAVVYPTAGNQTRGWVRLTQMGSQVKITAEITGLNANQKHGFHIHQFGDLTDAAKGKSAGGHYDPEGTKHHASPDADEPHHAGDLGNLDADAQGKAKYMRAFDVISISGANNPVLGRGIIIHAKPDDFGQPTGNAGARIGIAVIGVAKKPAK